MLPSAGCAVIVPLPFGPQLCWRVTPLVVIVWMRKINQDRLISRNR